MKKYLANLFDQLGFKKHERALILIITALFIAFMLIRFVSAMNKLDEDATKLGLKSLRDAVNLYYGENEGRYPTENIADELIENGYLTEIPYNYINGKSNEIIVSGFENAKDLGGWRYRPPGNEENVDRPIGSIWINSLKKDSDGDIWELL